MLFLILIAAVFTLVFTFRFNQKDIKKYEALVASASDQNVSHQLPKIDKQYRENTRKDLWKQDFSGNRLHYILTAPFSEVYLKSENKNNVFIEHFSSVLCYMQQKITKPSSLKQEGLATQEIQILTTPDGYYNYNSQVFSATDSSIERVLLPGDQLDIPIPLNTPFLTGYSEAIQIKFNSESPEFAAENLKLYFNRDKPAHDTALFDSIN